MKELDSDMPEDYQRNAAKLAEFLADREEYRAALIYLPPHIQTKVKAELAEFDRSIDKLEADLAAEYERIQAEKAMDLQMTKLVDKGWENSKRIYIIVKHQTPHLFESFTKQVIDPMEEEDREEFLDGVAILEATKLNEILKGEK